MPRLPIPLLRRSPLLLGAWLLLAALAVPPRAPAQQPPGPAGAAPAGPASEREEQLLERIRQLKSPRWRRFGACRYDWGGWRLAEGGVRVTAVECGEAAPRTTVGVHCESLRVSLRLKAGSWEPWRLPMGVGESEIRGGEDLMVASLCANLKPAAPKQPPQPKGPPRPKDPPKPRQESSGPKQESTKAGGASGAKPAEPAKPEAGESPSPPGADG